MILKGPEPVGFALVTRPRIAAAGEGTVNYHMSEFFVRKPYRRLGVGRDAATLIFDRFAGDWDIVEYQRNAGCRGVLATGWFRRIAAADIPNACTTAKCGTASPAGLRPSVERHVRPAGG